ncbi:MAG: RNA polymerase sigma factor [Elusimicrobia bacterium]|nr:RNA polymerase sigma factor [Elusimicrobiota bacterium]
MLERFIEEYAQEAFHFAYSLSGDVEQAKELVQEAFFRLIRTWDQYDESQRLDNWYLAILRNLYFDGLKKYESRNTVSLDVQFDSEEGEAGTTFAEVVADSRDLDLALNLERQETAERVHAAIESLSRKHRVILTMCDIQGLGYEKIASVLDCPLNTVRSRIFRARECLKTALLAKSQEVVE